MNDIIRQKLCDYLEVNNNCNNEFEKNNLIIHVNRMRINGIFGTGHELDSLSKLCNVNI